MLSCTGFLEPKKSRTLDLRNLRLMLKIPQAGCPGVYPQFSTQFSLEMHLATQNCPKIHKTPYFSVQGNPRSLLSVTIKSTCTTSY